MARTKAALKAANEQDLADGGLENLLGFHLRMANVAFYRDFTAAMAKLDITQRQAATLGLIEANPGVSQVDIANRLGSDRATIMGMIDRLENRGLITRVRAKTDRRRQELYLTPAGQKLCMESRVLISQHEQRFKSMFSDKELDFLMTALRRLQGV